MNQDHLMFICIIAVAVIAVYAIVKFADRVLPKPILPMGESDDEDGDEYAPKCESCGVPFSEHLGLIGTCKQLHEFGTELRRQKQEAWMRGDLQTASRIAVLIGDFDPVEHEKADLKKKEQP